MSTTQKRIYSAEYDTPECEKSDCPKSLRQDIERKIFYFEWEEDDKQPRKIYRTSFKRNSTIPGSIYTSVWEVNPLEALSDLFDKVKSGHDPNHPNPPDTSSSRNGIGTDENAKPQARYCEETLPEIKRSKRDKRLEYLITGQQIKIQRSQTLHRLTLDRAREESPPSRA